MFKIESQTRMKQESRIERRFMSYSWCLFVGLCALLILGSVSRSDAQNMGPWPTKAWSEASPESVGINSASLKVAEDVYPKIFPSSYSLLVIKNGKLVSESYFHGQSAETTNHIYSITKTFVATLIGIAVQQEWIDGVDQRVADLLPDFPVHPKLEALTLEDILTHRSGIPNNKNINELLKEEPRSVPGTTFQYSNHAPHLLTTILDRKVKQGVAKGVFDVQSLGQEYLFGPLGIKSITEWTKVSEDIPEGGNGLHMNSRDLARLGYLLLRDGRWEDEQILPTGWVETASKHHAEFDRQKGYGYLNWVRRRPDLVKTSEGEIEVQGYCAYGHRGQLIAVYPALDLLVVTTADATDPTRDTFFVPDLLHDFIRRFVFSAITK